MKKPVLLLGAIFLILFAVIAVFKSRPEPDATVDNEEQGVSEAARLQHRFWETYRRATELRLAGRLEEAAAMYQEALKINTDHEDALYYLGNVQLDLGNFAAAGAAWNDLVQVNPNSSRAYAQLGNLALCQKPDSLFDIDEAEAAYRHAMALNKEETAPVLRLGQVALMRGDLEKARTLFDAVTGSNFKSVEAYFLNGYVAWRQGRHKEAMDLFTRSFQHARPPEVSTEFSGEGDTKTGTTTLNRRTSYCAVFEPFIDDLKHLSEPITKGDLERHFHNLHSVLTQRRP